MTNPFKRTSFSGEHQGGTKRPALSSAVKGKAPALSPYSFTLRESQFLCQMCFDPKLRSESFSINGCSHSYCKDCTAGYIGTKLQQNMLQIRCPIRDCCGLLEPCDCRSILPEEVIDRWENAMSEAVENKQWWPKRKIFVERMEGCNFMSCVAGGAEKASSSHG